MKKAKPSTAASKGAGRGKSFPPKPPDLAEIRRQIMDLVGHGALDMVESTMEEAGKGHYLGMKYLFEMIGLFPVTAAEEAPVEDSLAAILLRRLGLPETPMAESRVTKESEGTAGASEDVLE
jgi:hypothetical protein